MTEIRLLTIADLAALENAAEDVFDNVDRATVSEFLADRRHHICAAIQDGGVVGFAPAVHYVHPDKPTELWINEVGVAPCVPPPRARQSGSPRASIARKIPRLR